MTRFGRNRKLVAAGVLVALVAGSTAAAASPPRSHVDNLVARMTLDEKLSFVHGSADPRDLGAAGYLPGVPRLGIPELRLTDGPAGVRLRETATAMPAPVALASTFDPSLAFSYGATVGRDGRALGMDVLLSPMVNTIRVPTAGRNFETFSEDPLVSARTVAADVRGIQSQGMIATVKHLAENNQETDRRTVDVNVDEQTLREIELPPFEAAADAGAGAVMCAYNKVNGDPACGNTELLNTILKQQWDFAGWVMSDWGATHSTDAITKGLDQEMPSGTYLGDALKAAIQNGSIPESSLDAAVKRIVGQIERFGLLRTNALPRPSRDRAAAARTARTVAERGAVLLRNNGGALPLSGVSAGNIAVVGPTARTPKVTGAGSSFVNPDSAAAPIDTIRARAGQDATVTYTPGGDLAGTPVPGSAISPPLPAAIPGGTATTYTGTLSVPYTGDYRIVLNADNGLVRLQIGGQAVYAGNTTGLQSGGWVHLTAGANPFDLRVSADAGKDLHVGMNWVTPEQAKALIPPAVAAARRAKTAIVFAYDDGTESADRASLALPGYQEELISEVTKANPNTIVVLNTGSSVRMPWLSGTRAVLDMWYPGQEGAEATTALLFGDASPTGRLPETFPMDSDHTPVAGHPERFPGVNGETQYSEGVEVGYRWYDREGVKPLFPFGYGLSYTAFSYTGVAARRVPGGLDVTATIRNTGARTGTEVPQIYLGASPDVTAGQAVRTLAGYTTVTLRPGESRQVRIHVGERQLQYWDTSSHGWRLGTGARTVWAGSSSADLPVSTVVEL